MDYHIIAPFFTGLIILGFSVAVYFNNKQSKIHLSYSLFMFSIALWSLDVTLLYYFKEPTILLFLVSFAYFIGGIIPVLFFYFSLVFPNEQFSVSKLSRFFIFLPTALFFILYFFTNFIIKDVNIVDGIRIISYGQWRFLFEVNFILFFTLGFIILIKKYFKSKGIIRRQLLIMIIGTFIGAVLASFTNVFLPWFNNFRFLWLGPELTLIWIGFIAYGIIRHQLLNIKIFILQSTFFILIIALIGGLFSLVLKQISAGSDVNLNANSNTLLFAFSGLINGLAALFFGVVGYKRNPKIFINKIFGLMNLSLALWSVSYWFWLRSNNQESALLWARSLAFFATFIPIFFLHWILILLKINKIKRWLIYPSYLITIILSLFSFTSLYVNRVAKEMFFEFWPKPGPVYHIFIILYVIIFGLGCFYLFKAYFDKNKLGFEKQQVKYILLGIMIGALGGFTNFPLWYGIKIPPYGNILVLAYIIGFAYAMLKYRLMDIRFFIIRTILYTLTVILVGGLFALAVFYLGQNILGSTFWGIIIGSIIISLGLEPLFGFLRRLTDQYFFQAKYNYQKTLRELVNSMTQIIDLQNLLNTITTTIKNSLKVKKIAIIILAKADNLPFVIKQAGFNTRLEAYFSKKKPLVEYLAQKQDELVAGELEIEIERGQLTMPAKQAEMIISEMRQLDLSVCFPIISNNNLIGVLALGHKQSGEVFSGDDIELLSTASKQAGIAIENARLYKEVQDFSKTLQSKVDEQTKYLKELLEMKSDFLRVVNHQLNTPLSIMKGYFSMMEEGSYPTEKALPPIKAGLERISSTVADFWQAYELEGERMKMEPQKTDLAEIVNKLILEKQKIQLARERKLIIEVEPPKFKMPLVWCDYKKISHAVSNLLDNAVHYTRQGKITVYYELLNDYLQINIKDTGAGITNEDKNKLFQKFSRGQHATDLRPDGSGLGLFIAKKIVEGNFGRMSYLSGGENQGSVFSFTMPIYKNQQPEKIKAKAASREKIIIFDK